LGSSRLRSLSDSWLCFRWSCDDRPATGGGYRQSRREPTMSSFESTITYYARTVFNNKKLRVKDVQ